MASTSSAKTLAVRKSSCLDSFSLPIEARAVWLRHNLHVPLSRQLCRYLDLSEDKTSFRIHIVEKGLYLEICDKRGNTEQ